MLLYLAFIEPKIKTQNKNVYPYVNVSKLCSDKQLHINEVIFPLTFINKINIVSKGKYLRPKIK